MGNIQNLQTQNQIQEKVVKKQNFFIGKCCLIAGGIFTIIFAVSFLLSNYVFIKNGVDINYLILIGSISLIISVILSLIMSFRGIRASIGLIIFSILFYSLAFIAMFSAYFSILGNTVMFYSLIFTALSIFLLGIISFIIPQKITYSLFKISLIAFGIYFLISIIGSLFIWFIPNNSVFEIWQIIVTVIIGFVIISSTIFSFYSLKKTSEFVQIGNIDSQTYTKLLLFQSFNILSSIMVVFMLVLRILGFVNRN